jgi:hypothetical protein
MSNLLTDWREALEEYLSVELDAEIVAGPRIGLSRDHDLIGVWWPGQAASARSINFANPRMTVRYWRKRPKTTLKEVPFDPRPLEQGAIDLLKALEPKRVELLPGKLYFEIPGIKPLPDEYALEAELLGWAVNPAAIAGA